MLQALQDQLQKDGRKPEAVNALIRHRKVLKSKRLEQFDDVEVLACIGILIPFAFGQLVSEDKEVAKSCAKLLLKSFESNGSDSIMVTETMKHLKFHGLRNDNAQISIACMGLLPHLYEDKFTVRL